jgi:hypothetical protein
MKIKIKTIALILLALGIVSSCNTENTKNDHGHKKPSKLGVYLYLKGGIVPQDLDSTAWLNATLATGEDTLRIDTMYVFQGNSKFILASRSLPMPRIRPLLYFRTTDLTVFIGNMRPLIDGNIHNPVFYNMGKKYAGTYKALHLKMSPISYPPVDSNLPFLNKKQTKAVFEGGPYSIIINGTYNDSKFTFKSKKEFDISLKLNPPVHIDSVNDVASITVVSNVLKWFKNGNSLLNPSDTSNKSVINANIANSFSIEDTVGKSEKEIIY